VLAAVGAPHDNAPARRPRLANCLHSHLGTEGEHLAGGSIPHIRPMRKRVIEWEVIRLRAKGEYLGVVSAPDEEAAFEAAIKAFEITSVEHQKQLLVRRA
jgi:hypothetical protein